MFDTKSSFILSKLGIKRFQSRINKPNSEVFFGVLWGDILTLLDKSFNELEENELKLLTKIIKSIAEDESEYPFSNEINNLNEIKSKPKLVISFTDVKTNLTKEFSPLIESKPLSILEKSQEYKRKLWMEIKEYKNGSSTG
jgi:DNA polymerase III psi subunit